MFNSKVVATMLLAVNVDKKPMIGLADKAIKDLFHNPTDMFWTGRVMDVLFDGIPIDCSSENFEATATCSVFKSGEVAAIREHNETHFAFSLFSAVMTILTNINYSLQQLRSSFC